MLGPHSLAVGRTDGAGTWLEDVREVLRQSGSDEEPKRGAHSLCIRELASISSSSLAGASGMTVSFMLGMLDRILLCIVLSFIKVALASRHVIHPCVQLGHETNRLHYHLALF